MNLPAGRPPTTQSQTVLELGATKTNPSKDAPLSLSSGGSQDPPLLFPGGQRVESVVSYVESGRGVVTSQ